MKGGLFFKIVLAALCFWAAMFVLTGFLIAVIDSRARPTIEEQLRRALAVDAAATASALEFGGLAAAEKLAADLPDHDLVDRTIAPAGTALAEVAEPKTVTVEQNVTTPEGRFVVRYSSTVRRYFGPQREHLAFLATLPVLLAFAVLLALYVTRPYAWLRSGFRAVAEGDLKVRLWPRVRRRKDEVAGLAADFDRMVEHLESLLTMRDRLLHDVSHELRSPLARLLIAAELARQNPSRTEASLERIELEAHRLNKLVDELIALARAETSGRLDNQFDMAHYAQLNVTDMQYEAVAMGRTLTVRFGERCAAGSGLLVQGDPDLLRRGMENVIRNALKASPPGGTVELVAHEDRTTGMCRIQVMDRGPGVPEEALEAIFQPFFRVARGEGQGLGLGLAIARRAFEAHGGSVCAVNREGGGLVVSIEFAAQMIDDKPPIGLQ